MRGGAARGGAVIAAIVAVVAVAWWVASGGDERSLPLAGTGAESSSAASQDDASAGGALPSASPAARDAAPLPAATRALDESRSPDESDGLAIEVVDAASGAPCGGARLLAFWGSEPWWLGRFLQDDATLAAKRDAAYVADPDGRARIRPRGASDWIVALHGESWGLAQLDPTKPEPLRIAVAPRETLEVEVVDARGAAAPGIKVEIGKVRPDDGRGRRLMLRFDSCAETTSDAAGRARFRGLEFVTDLLAGGTLSVVASPPLAAQVAAAVPPREQRTAPLRVTLPRMGTVQVRLVDARGEVVPVDAIGTIMGSGEGLEPGESVRFPLASGIAAPVAIGVGIAPTAFIVPPGLWQLKASRPGPTAIDEQVTLDIVVPSTRMVALSGSVVLDDGAPWHGALDLRWLIPTERTGVFDNPVWGTTTDESGGFETAIVESAFKFGAPTVTFSTKRGDDVALSSERLPLPEWRGQAALDVGERLVLHAPAVVIEGVVVDAEGRRIPDVSVNAYRKERPDDDPFTKAFGSIEFQHSVDGRFRLVAPRIDDEIRVNAFTRFEGWTVEGAATWKGGSKELRIVVTKRGAVALRVLLPDGLPSRALYAGLRLPEWRSDDTPRTFSSVALDGRDEALLETDPRAVDVVVRSNSDTRPLFEQRDVVVRPGEVTRLAEIDLRDVVRALRVTVLDPDGAPAKRGSARIYEAGRMTVPIDQAELRGKPIELVTRQPVDLFITSPGCRSLIARGVSSDHTVQLAGSVGVEVQMRFRRLPPLEGSQRWWVRLHRLETPLDRSEWPVARLDDEGECEFAVDDPGDYEFTLQRDFEAPRDVPNPRVLIRPDSFSISAAPEESTLVLDVEPIE